MKTLREANWQEILVQCKNNVQTNIQPYLKRISERQPNLGMGAGGDAMKPVDLAAEKAIVDILRRRVVSFTLISEESGIRKFGDEAGNCYVTVDPVDGTTNLMHGLPFYACSIAISQKPMLADVYAGLVVDLFHDVTYMGFKDRGAYRDGKKIGSSKTVSLDEAVIGLDLNTYRVKEVAPKVTALIEKTKHIRHFGANALELCYVANGLTDAFVDMRGKLRTTDVAAAFLIIKEAGGIVTTPENETLDVELNPQQRLSFLASGNNQIHEKIFSLVKRQ